MRGADLLGGVREIIQTEYFEHRKNPMEISDTLQTEKQLCTAYTRHCLTEKIRWHLQGACRKNYGGGMNMTMEELTTLLNVSPTSSDSLDAVILLDYCLTTSMAIVFTTNRFLETARLIYVEQQQADVCKALSDSQGSFRPSLSEVEAMLGNDWRPPLHVTVPGLSPQQFEFKARHFRDLTNESYVTDCAQIVVYY